MNRDKSQDKIQENLQELVDLFEKELINEERSRATVKKYCRDVRAFLHFADEGRAFTKEQVMEYKEYLAREYAVSSANSMLTAINIFLRFAGHPECTVKTFRTQRETCRPESRELSWKEYVRLLNTAKRRGNDRLYFLMQTICATGIRISELPFITVEALKRRRARVSLKGKSRVVAIPEELCRKLQQYVRERQIISGSVFVTRSGRPMDRSNILHEMKALCAEACVKASKVFPHNLRHLFAVTYYKKEKDICHLADILGHAAINTTRIYTLISSAEQSRQIESLGLVI